MRGSPLIRFLLLALALGGVAAGLTHVTAPRATGNPSRPVEISPPTETPKPGARYQLVLSAAGSVTLDTGSGPHAAPLAGNVDLDPANPYVALTVRWKSAEIGHRFAKLTVEQPGRETFTHVFDAEGDIDDLVELPTP